MTYRKVILDGEERWMRGDRLAEAPIDKVTGRIYCAQFSEDGPHYLYAKIERMKTGNDGANYLTTLWHLTADDMTVSGLESFLEIVKERFQTYNAIEPK